MLFHVTFEVYDTIVLEGDRRLRETLGPRIQQIMQSPKVQQSGVLSGKRAGFLQVNIDAPEELTELLGPEILGNFRVDAQPVTPTEKLGELLQQWACEGR